MYLGRSFQAIARCFILLAAERRGCQWWARVHAAADLENVLHDFLSLHAIN